MLNFITILMLSTYIYILYLLKKHFKKRAEANG